MNRTRAAVILLLIATLMVSLPVFLTVPVRPDAKDYILIVLGWFTAKGSDAIAYLLNSTDNSARRSETMAKATDVLLDSVRGTGAPVGLGGAPPPPGAATVQVTPPATVEVQAGPAAAPRDPDEELFTPKP